MKNNIYHIVLLILCIIGSALVFVEPFAFPLCIFAIGSMFVINKYIDNVTEAKQRQELEQEWQNHFTSLKQEVDAQIKTLESEISKIHVAGNMKVTRLS